MSSQSLQPEIAVAAATRVPPFPPTLSDEEAALAKRAKPKSKAKPKVARARGVLGRVFRAFLIMVVIFGLIGPVAVVTLYRFVPPPMTFLMVQRLFEGRGFDR